MSTLSSRHETRRTDLLSQNDKKLEELPPVNTRVEIAKAAGVSTGQVGMAFKVESSFLVSQDEIELIKGRLLAARAWGLIVD